MYIILIKQSHYRIRGIYGKHYIWRMKKKTELAKNKIGGQPFAKLSAN